ncbi:MFS transporter [Streptomyces sp. NPDC001508]|uniref:MFS transporter n=1 Tax=Streptomyces sp. NPDC001508 TaxID=3154656 RepID=UPI0033329AD9
MSSFAMTDLSPRPGFYTRLLIACCGGPFLDGYVMSIIGVAMTGVVKEFAPTTSEIGLIGASALIGMFLGASVFGYLTDRVGRKKMYALDLTVLVGACALSAFVEQPWQLIVLRFVMGAAVGADYPIATSLLTELSPTRKRGTMVGMAAVAWNAGAAAAYLVGGLVMGLFGGYDQWRWLLFSSAVLGAIVILMRHGIPESPRWLLSNGRVADAEKAAQKIYGTKFSLDGMRGTVPQPVEVDLRIFLHGTYLRRLIMCIALYIAVVAPMYALLTFLPTILSGFGVAAEGVSGIVIETVVIGLLLIGSLPAVVLVEKWGRRPLTVIPLGLMVIPLAGLWLWAGGPLWFTVFAFCAYMFISGGPGILVWIYPNELFPTEVRATAVGIAAAFSRLGSAAGTYLLPLSIASLGTGTTMLFGALLTGGAFLICCALAPETKGQSLEATSAGSEDAKKGADREPLRFDSDLI